MNMMNWIDNQYKCQQLGHQIEGHHTQANLNQHKKHPRKVWVKKGSKKQHTQPPVNRGTKKDHTVTSKEADHIVAKKDTKKVQEPNNDIHGKDQTRLEREDHPQGSPRPKQPYDSLSSNPFAVLFEVIIKIQSAKRSANQN